ncbi:hypothetical protein BCU70_21365 [Vibrio sp. 10N.286.49.C2]|uniref:O-antigen ligase family protein n=1 Tax=unclassified Vibrio TaxID=2614977 RepID=UPI000C86406C|nr:MULTISPECIES: O-antigen ligase family protein [unclassified Vibrio]PMH32130.1 hypothetical protein BCU70_21365 [Vibrio sp. 10N.286.49.C2]PMH47975.1 hypothetical protein BCU66_21740 [Vibrio sp. 10N.286.49.B1]
MKTKVSWSEFCQNISLIYLILWLVIPIMAYGVSYRLLALAATIVWVMIEISKNNSVISRPTTTTLGILAYIGYVSFITVFTVGISNLTIYIQVFILFVFYIMSESYNKSLKVSSHGIIKLLLIVMPISLSLAIVALVNNPRASRVLVRSSAEAVELSSTGAGGFSFAYFCVVYVAILMFLAVGFSGRWKILVFVNLIMTCIFIVMSQYSTAIIIMFLALVLSIMASLNKNLIISCCTIVIGICIILVVYSCRIQIIDFLHDLFTGLSNVQLKLMDMKYAIVTGESEGTVSDRTERYWRSLELFLNNPIFGSIERDDVGKHSFLLDTFAQYGVFIGLLVCYIIVKPISKVKVINSSERSFKYIIIFIATCLFSLNNPAMSYGVAFFLLPTLAIHARRHFYEK